MYNGFLTARTHLVIFQKTYKFVHIDVNSRDWFMWRKEFWTKLIVWLNNVFNLLAPPKIKEKML